MSRTLNDCLRHLIPKVGPYGELYMMHKGCSAIITITWFEAKKYEKFMYENGEWLRTLPSNIIVENWYSPEYLKLYKNGEPINP